MSDSPLPDSNPRAPGRVREAGSAVKLDTIGWLLGLVLVLVAIAMLAPLILALVLGEPWRPFGRAIAVEALVGGALLLGLRRRARALDHRSAFLAVALSWVLACLAGSVPYVLSPDLGLSLVDSLFESFSGFTTTGATVLSDLESKPRSLLLWRALSQWIGGMGVVLIGVAVLPILGIGGMALYKAEAPGPSKDKLVPRISETARILWALYLGLTVLGIVALKLCGMSLFDAVCHAMCAIATAGFSTHDASFGHFSSGWVRLTGMTLMVLGATSFAVLHRTLTRGIPWSGSLELRAYVGLLVIGSLVVALDLRSERPDEFVSTLAALDRASFQVVSIGTTSGFTSANYDAWPALSKSVLFLL
ncbi:MAG: TrkH family potassium uptake protein, partial [Proteobacteria bacterium]|nr:TrkH family potassium uptake protein [Pseudomonadota bacterium]